LLHDPERIFAWGQLLGLRAACEQAGQEPAKASATRELARAMIREAIQRSSEPRPDWTQFLEAMGIS
jgi:hypothetical protein